MKRILNLPTMMLLFVAALFMTSCEDDGTGGGGGGGTTDTAPTVTLVSASELTLSPGESFTIEFTASKGTNEMNALTVYENGTKVPVDRLQFNGAAASSNTPLLIGTDRESLSWTATIVAQSTANTTSNFEIEVQDDTALKTSIFVTVATASAPPTLTALGNTTPTYVEGTQNVSFKVMSTTGGGQLSTMEIRQNEVLLDVADFNWNGLSMMTMGNPFALSDTELDGFDEGTFIVDLPMEVGTFVYTMIVEDIFDSRDTATFVVTTESSGTALDSVLVGVLFNAGGDVGFGGLDLDNGMSTGTGATSGAGAEIVDNGIDTDQGPATNWIQTISPFNGATMKYVVAGAGGVLESFTFADVDTKEAVADAYDVNSTTEITEAESTSVINVGDMFAVRSGSKTYLIMIQEVNLKAADNTDNYVVDIKY